MNLDKFLTFVTQHNAAIIQWLFFGILLLAGTLIARSLFGKKTEEHASGGDLQSALEKILAQTTKLENVSVDRLSGAGSPQTEALVTALKADLAVREKELVELKAGGGGGAVANDLSARIKELESKLAEYEILEDDIADLSLYKEENQRLKSELDRVKVNPAAATVAAAPEMTEVEAPEPEIAEPELAAVVTPSPAQGEEIVAEFAQVLEQEPEALKIADAAKIDVPDTGDPMADFESTLQIEKQLAKPSVPAAPSPAATPAPAPAPEAVAQAEADDLFGEFSQSSSDDQADLDTDKMMAEMAALVGMEPATGSALEENIDTDKMADEATSLHKS